MITLKSVYAEAFLSYEELLFDFNSGFHSIVGVNGSGKSSIMEAVVYAVYGKTVRNTKQVEKRGSKNKCGVVLNGEIDGKPFTITRTKGKVDMSVSYRTVTTSGNSKIDQEHIEKTIGMNFTLFTSCFLFGHNSFRFTQAKDSERKEIIEEFLDISRIESAYELVSQDLSSISSKRTMLQSKISANESVLDRELENSSRSAAEGAKVLAAAEKTKKGIEQEIDVLLKKARLLCKDASTQNISKIRQRFMDLSNESVRYLSLMGSLNKTKEVISSGSCSSCGQKIDKKYAQQRMRELSEEFEEADRKRSDAKHQESRLGDALSILAQVKEKESALDVVNANLRSIRSADKKSNKERTSNINSIKKTINDLRVELEELKEEEDGLTFLRQAFRRSGVVSLLIDDIIRQLNAECEYVSDVITDGYLRVTFSPFKELKTGGSADKIAVHVEVDGEESLYENLSNGERQRVDVIVMFAWAKVIEGNTKPINASFFDEVFEGLDDSAAESVLQYVMGEREDRCSYFMTHVADNQPVPDSVIFVEKKPTGSVMSIV